MTTPASLTIGAPFPFFVAPTLSNPRFQFGSVAGRWICLVFIGSAGNERTASFLATLFQRADRFDGVRCAFFGVSVDPEDVQRQPDRVPGIRWFRDHQGELSRAVGVLSPPVPEYRPVALVLDPTLRIHTIIPASPEAAEPLGALLDALPAPADHVGVPQTAPVLVVPRVLSPDLCNRLIAHYHEVGGKPSGFMREVDGKTVGAYDEAAKRRTDAEITSEAMRTEVRDGVVRALVPMIQRAFQFNATRIERYIVACYDGADQGFFRAHRDNTTPGTAHRRFAVSINLNTGEYEGGGITFPEFGNTVYHAPLGGAVVFSCSLLHEAQPVTRGKRYATLPFLYDEASARLRQANAGTLVTDKTPLEQPGAVSKIQVSQAAPVRA
ncbi:MAG: 2OG-Fe(II) oxygenase [Alphaproteobacteria bacterium]|nr:2OG-Fe(II) oxygenase [Alphaproteobacteria bacterium]